MFFHSIERRVKAEEYNGKAHHHICAHSQPERQGIHIYHCAYPWVQQPQIICKHNFVEQCPECIKSQHKGNSLKNTWIIGGDSLINFRVGSIGAESDRNSSRDRSAHRYIFLNSPST